VQPSIRIRVSVMIDASTATVSHVSEAGEHTRPAGHGPTSHGLPGCNRGA
jgi:hypothetical protein